MKSVSFKPVVALVGRANVGKSTLFNRLTRSRAALVANFPGLTRDRHYGEGRVGSRPYIVVDTGGFEPVAKTGMLSADAVINALTDLLGKKKAALLEINLQALSAGMAAVEKEACK